MAVFYFSNEHCNKPIRNSFAKGLKSMKRSAHIGNPGYLKFYSTLHPNIIYISSLCLYDGVVGDKK